ncbi:MAG: hypothetical protein KAQ94_08615 [Arcobacteraceae bacterium]|nr:hypothetical protein [Arcobacteraceae bacterium]
MSMSQEEIEALMNETADIAVPAEEVVVEDDTQMSSEDISELVAASDEKEDTSQAVPQDDNLDDILAGIDGITEDEPVLENDDIVEEEPVLDNDDIVEEEPVLDNDDIIEEEPVLESVPQSQEISEDVSAMLDEQISKGVYPLPVEKEHKVVNQLNEVAQDSEEKVTKIFDVLSLVLDENANIEKNIKDLGSFVEKQITLLEALSNKFPNVAVLGENLELARSLTSISPDTCKTISEENNQIFVAMELMQFNDINRQKIERVMSVIKKLSQYLNGIFEDDSDRAEVQIAKHISGDSSEALDEDDIDSLIADFGN